MSERDIEAGQRWNAEISSRLKATDFGIICLTPENITAPWLLFEAGALAKALDSARVIPLLLGLGKVDLEFPLAQFQAVEANRDGFFALVSAINQALSTDRLEKTLLNNIFNLHWPSMDASVQSLRDAPSGSSAQNQRSDRELLEDVLTGVRALQRNPGLLTQKSMASDLSFSDWEDYFIRAVNLANMKGDAEVNNAALRNYAQAIAMAPFDLASNMLSRLYAYHSAMLKRLGRLDEAKNGLVLALQLASEDREINDAMYNMACVLAMSGDTKKTISELRKLISRAPQWARIVAASPYFAKLSIEPEFQEIIKSAN